MSNTPLCLDDFQTFAKKYIPRVNYEYFACGSDGETTLHDNVNSFKRWRIRPRVLRDTTRLNVSTSILGNPFTFPVCVSPTAFHGLVHKGGESETAKGASTAGIGFTLSSHSGTSMDALAASSADLLRFMQVYLFPDRDLTLQLVRRAADCGFKALVVTMDAPILGRRNYQRYEQDDKHWRRFRAKAISQVYATLQHKNSLALDKPGESAWVPFFHRNRPDDLKWLVNATHLPVIAKGILTGEDADMAIECGVKGILVSNHGGRQLYTVMSTIDALPEVMSAARGRCEVYMDGGVRSGTDIFKALALGAQAVFIGRPAVFALFYNGQKGVKEMLGILKAEFETTMALAGCETVGDIKREMVVHEWLYKSQL